MKKKIKILTVIGARPQFIKSAVFSHAVKDEPSLEEIIVHTGQHYDDKMSEIFYEDLNLPRPKYVLNAGGLSHGAMTGQLIEKIEQVCLNELPDMILVYGDTNSTLAGAVAGVKLHIPIAHIEAGLRSYNMAMPEEVNRILTDRVSTLLFCPTEAAVKNLELEGYDKFSCKIVNAGDVMFDMIKLATKIVDNTTSNSNPFILATIHRAENTDDINRLKDIIRSFNTISEDICIKLPLHPRTKKFISENDIFLASNIEVLEPVGYFEMIKYLKNCSFVMTDSGGLQKEAYFMKKNCLILRDETEWVELVENGNNVIVGSTYDLIIEGYRTVETLNKDFSSTFYGDGESILKIKQEIFDYFNKG